jgi:hypothetical protein
MKSTIQSLSPAKFHRMKQSKSAIPVLARLFKEATWDSTVAYTAFQYEGYVYTMERTNERNFHTVYKRYPVNYATPEQCLLVSKLHKWI